MVIARFSWLKMVVFLPLLLFMVAGCAYVLYEHDMREPFFWFCIFAMPILILYPLTIMRELLFHRARSVWIEAGKLVFVPFGWPASLTAYLYRIPVDDIARLSVERLYTGGIRPRGVVVYRKSGGFAEIPTHLLVERYDDVLRLLSKALGLPTI